MPSGSIWCFHATPLSTGKFIARQLPTNQAEPYDAKCVLLLYHIDLVLRLGGLTINEGYRLEAAVICVCKLTTPECIGSERFSDVLIGLAFLAKNELISPRVVIGPNCRFNSNDSFMVQR